MHNSFEACVQQLQVFIGLMYQMEKDLLMVGLRKALGKLGTALLLCLIVSVLAVNKRHSVSRLTVQHITQTLNSLKKMKISMVEL